MCENRWWADGYIFMPEGSPFDLWCGGDWWPRITTVVYNSPAIDNINVGGRLFTRTNYLSNTPVKQLNLSPRGCKCLSCWKMPLVVTNKDLFSLIPPCRSLCPLYLLQLVKNLWFSQYKSLCPSFNINFNPLLLTDTLLGQGFTLDNDLDVSSQPTSQSRRRFACMQMIVVTQRKRFSIWIRLLRSLD